MAQVASATPNRNAHSIRTSILEANSNAESGGDATTATDTTAQTVAAAAAQAVTGTDSNDPASQDQLATPDIGPNPAVAAPTILPPVAAAAAGSPAAATSAVSTALANARTINALANVNTAIGDKTSRDGNSDAPMSSVSSDGTVGAAQLLTTNTTTDASTTTTFKVAAPVETAEFSQGVADRVSFMVDGNISSAKLQVNPPALGPIEVRIALQGSHAQVSFTSHSALTRDALESSAPKLREMLGSQGFGQVSVDVSHGSFQDRSAQSSPYQSSAVNARDSSLDAAQPVARSGARTAAGVLDAYA
jgi:flagellar hook-length control protein FliK